MNIKFDVNSEFLDEAEKQIFEILIKQRLSYNERWFNRPAVIKAQIILRMIGLVLSLFAVMLCGASLAGKLNWGSSPIGPGVAMIFFIASGVFFYFLPRIGVFMKNWNDSFAINKSCKKLAAKMVVKARNIAPYKAEYDIKAGVVSYFREKNDELKPVWTRKLKGVAVQSGFATIIFRKWTSIIPAIVILHDDSEIVGKALVEQKIDCKLVHEI